MRTRSNQNVSEYSARFIHRVRASAGDSIRHNLFALRCELLWAVTRILQGIERRRRSCDDYLQIDCGGVLRGENRLVDKQMASIRGAASLDGKIDATHAIGEIGLLGDRDRLFDDSDRLYLASYWAQELCVAVAEGLTLRTLKAYLEVLQTLVEGCSVPSYSTSSPAAMSSSSSFSPHSYSFFSALNPPSSSSPLRAPSFMSVALTLQSTLKYLDNTHHSILCSVTQIVLLYWWVPPSLFFFFFFIFCLLLFC